MRLLPTAKLLPGFTRHPRPVSAVAAPAQQDAAAAFVPSCGWFDSSLDLVEGLEVSETRDALLYQLWSQAFSDARPH